MSLWWDGDRKIPYIVVEGETQKSLIFSAAILSNYDNQYTPVVHSGFEEGLIVDPNVPINFTAIDGGINMGIYYWNNNGCSLLVDRLIVVDPETNDGVLVTFSLHTVGLVKKNVIVKYTVTEIVTNDDNDGESVGV